MRLHPDISELQRIHPLRIMPPASDALKKKMNDAVAWRAFELYESHGWAAGHDRENWLQAEADVVRPLDCGTIVQDHRVCLTTNISCFAPGTLELWIEPHRITLCGPNPSRRLERTGPAAAGSGLRNLLFLTHELDSKVEPAEVTVRFNGPAMHIYVRRAALKPQMAAMAHAA
jgi:Protein of unknown function (DUF2934)